MKSFDTPVLLLLFKRPEETRRLLERLRTVAPTRVFVFADGPKKPEDQRLSEQTRELVTELITWPCELTRNYSEVNLGCRVGVGGAIDWFFDQVEEGIILEDDCIPSLSFFEFCAQLLVKYRHNPQISQISGFNTAGTIDVPESYLYSKLGTIWGWATWRRAWNRYPKNASLLDLVEKEHVIEHFFAGKPGLIAHRKHILGALKAGTIDSWVYYWTFAKMCMNNLAVVSSKNLVQNIGFSSQATHTAKNEYLEKLPVFDVTFPLSEPVTCIHNTEFDAINYKRTTAYQRFERKESRIDHLKRFWYGT